jgi:hypothetical protein
MQFFAQLHLWQCLVWMEVSCHQPVGKISFWHPNCNYWDQVRELSAVSRTRETRKAHDWIQSINEPPNRLKNSFSGERLFNVRPRT